MTPEEYADFTEILGNRVLRVGKILWSEVRPCFVRPTLPVQQMSRLTVTLPRRTWFGGYQHAVPPGEASNSFLNALIFLEGKDYQLSQLDYNRRRQIKIAQKEFRIERMRRSDGLAKEAHPIYLEFYGRTNYATGADRCDLPKFSRWVDDIFARPKLMILGAYRQNRLEGVSVSMAVLDQVIYSSFFCATAAFDSFLPDLMLHTVRSEAAKVPGIKQVFASMYKTADGLNKFYMLRGATLVRQPAFLHMNPVALLLLRKWKPNYYRQLRGHLNDVVSSKGLCQADSDFARQS